MTKTTTTTEIATEIDTDTETDTPLTPIIGKKRRTPLSTPPTALYDEEKNIYVSRNTVGTNLLSHFDEEDKASRKKMKTSHGGRKTKKNKRKICKKTKKNKTIRKTRK